MLSVWKGKEFSTHDTIYWEHEGGRAIRIDNWKLVALSNEPWELFDLTHDNTESQNLAAEHPDRVKEMEQLWKRWFAMVTQ